MIRFPWSRYVTGKNGEKVPLPLRRARCPERGRDLRFEGAECREKLKRVEHVAVVGGGFAGLMAARRLVQQGIKVTVFEARPEVGGRVLSNTNFSAATKGRIIEEGAELIGSFHTRWLELAREFGLAMISRMDAELYERECLDVRLMLEDGKFLSMKEFWRLTKKMNENVLMPLADLAEQKIKDPSRPWLQSVSLKDLKDYDNMSAAYYFETKLKVSRNSLLWKMLEFKLVNDEVASLDKMNFLGLLCKVRAGQDKRCVEDDDIRPSSSCIKDGYWEELEIFRCADGCQTLAKKIADKIQTRHDGRKLAEVRRRMAVTHINLSNAGVKLSVKATKKDGQFVDNKPSLVIPGFFSYVVLAIPPNVWRGVTITANGKKVDPEKEIGQMHMNDAVKYFSDVKERFWIKQRSLHRPNRGFAPYGGSLRIGQVWEGTDNQTRIPNQGIVLSVFAGPISAGHAPTREDFEDDLRRLYPEPKGYRSNLNYARLRNWPTEPFIKTGYWSPHPGEIFKVGEKLTKPYHDRLFFAGDHTQMDFFGYMEGALRSGERAAETLMLHACGLLKETPPTPPPPSKPEGPMRVASAKPARESAEFEREVEILPLGERASADYPDQSESPFLARDLLIATEGEQSWKPRAAALVAESPFVSALEERERDFDWDKREEQEAPDEFDREDSIHESAESQFGEEEQSFAELEPTAEINPPELEEEFPYQEPETEADLEPETEADLERLIEAQLAGEDDRKEQPPSAQGYVDDEEEFVEEAFEGELHESEAEDEPLQEGFAQETLPAGERSEDLEEYQTSGPAGLVLLDHMHVPKTSDPKHPGTFKTGSLTSLKTTDLNPGFIDASDNLITDTSDAGLQRCLNLLITSDFKGLLTDRNQTDPRPGDSVRVALVDLTGNKLTKPDFAGWRSTAAIYGASVPKILAVYAAFQLRSDLRELAGRKSPKSPKDGADLEKQAIAEWNAKGLAKLLPNLVWLFDIRRWKEGSTLDFTANARSSIHHIKDNCPAADLIVNTGFPYIGSVAWQSGLYHAKRGGLWLRTSYCGKATWASPVATPNSANATALSAATYFTLLAQGRLVDDTSSSEIRTALRLGCKTSLFPPLPIVASKCGIWRKFVHDSALIEDKEVRYAVAVMSRLTTNNQAKLYTKLCKELDRLVRENNRSPSQGRCASESREDPQEEISSL